jgi:hypothetical protein
VSNVFMALLNHLSNLEITHPINFCRNPISKRISDGTPLHAMQRAGTTRRRRAVRRRGAGSLACKSENMAMRAHGRAALPAKRHGVAGAMAMWRAWRMGDCIASLRPSIPAKCVNLATEQPKSCCGTQRAVARAEPVWADNAALESHRMHRR